MLADVRCQRFGRPSRDEPGDFDAAHLPQGTQLKRGDEPAADDPVAQRFHAIVSDSHCGGELDFGRAIVRCGGRAELGVIDVGAREQPRQSTPAAAGVVEWKPIQFARRRRHTATSPMAAGSAAQRQRRRLGSRQVADAGGFLRNSATSQLKPVLLISETL